MSDAEPSAEDIAAAEPKKKPKRNGSDLQNRAFTQPDIHRLLPQSPDAEQGLLSSFLISPKHVGGLCADKSIRTEHFHIPAHATIYGVLYELWEANMPIDFIQLSQILRDRNKLDQCGGAAFITQLFVFLPTAANASYYAEILEEKYTLRTMIQTCTEYAARSYDQQDEVATLLDQLEASVLSIASGRAKLANSSRSSREMAKLGMAEIERRMSMGREISGLSTGLPSLDAKTDGLHEQELIVVGAIASLGKSALCMQIIDHLAVELRIPCAVFPLEMGPKQLSQRMIFTRAEVNPIPWRYGYPPTPEDCARMTKAASDIGEAPIFTQDVHDCTIQGVRAQARRLVANHGVRVILIDSLSALHSDSRQGRDSRVREAAECSEGCKQMAKELGITVLLVCHIDRDLARSDRPSTRSLRETGKIELDADSIWFLYEPDFNEEQPEGEPEIEIWIPKQRDGEPFVSTKLEFQKRFTRFRDHAHESAEQEQLI